MAGIGYIVTVREWDGDKFREFEFYSPKPDSVRVSDRQWRLGLLADVVRQGQRVIKITSERYDDPSEN